MKGESVIFKRVYNMKFEELPTEKIYKYMPFSGSSHKLLFRFNGLKSCRYNEGNVEGVVAPFNGCYIVENNWHNLLGTCDFFSLLWFSRLTTNCGEQNFTVRKDC